ncbi:MAG TPA: hypothetical protein VM012_06650 [Flavitalea sp.]|nr:hypothetical protein [Flavitalea sp.]
MGRYYFLIMIVVFPADLISQTTRYQLRQSNYVEGAYSNQFASSMEFFSNRASILQPDGMAVMVFSEKKYLLPELGLFMGGFAKSLSSGAFAILLQHNGYDAFRESTFTLIHALHLGKVDIAVSFDFQKLQISGYKIPGRISGTISSILHLSPNFQAGLEWENVQGLFRRKNSQEISSTFKGGVGYNPSDLVHIAVEWIREANDSPTVIAGLLYRFHKTCQLQIGMSVPGIQPYGGIQIWRNQWSMTLRTAFHPALGVSPSLGIQVHIAGKAAA